MRIVRLCFFAAAVCAIAGCSGSKFSAPEPEAEITRCEIDSISLRDITFVFDLEITNPYPAGIKLEAVKLDFFVEGKALLSTRAEGISIAARKKGTSTFRVTLKYADIIGIVSDYAKRDYLAALVKAEIVMPLPAIPGLPPSLSFSYDIERKIPAVKPRVFISNFKVREPSQAEIAAALKAAGKALSQSAVESALRGLLAGKPQASSQSPQAVDFTSIDVPLTVSFDIELVNETRAELLFADLAYDFAVNGAPLIKGRSKDIVKKGGRSVVSVENRFSSKSLTSSVVRAFQAGRGDFSLAGGTSLRFPEAIRKEPVPLSFTEGGSFNLR